ASVTRRAQRNVTGRMIANVPVDVSVHRVLRGRVPGGERLLEFIPVLRRVDIEERVVYGIESSPAQRNFAGLARNQVGNDGAVTSEDHIHGDISLVLDMNHFRAMVGRLPSAGRLIRALRVEGLNIKILNRGSNVRESPGNAAIVSDDHEWQAG